MIEGKLLLVGAGNMGGAMLRRWLDAGLDPAQVTVVTPSGRALPDGVRGVPAIPEAETFEVVMLGMKPQQLSALAGGPLAGLAPRLLLSILAGVEIATLVPLTRAGAVVRAMPNLPVALGSGVTALHGAVDSETIALAGALARPLGHVEWIADEALFDAVTAVSGCGPAFLFRFVDALADAGTALGLPADQAMRLARATVAGSARMAETADDSPSTLADRVASPGGSTRAGLNVLDDGEALNRLLARTVRASRDRNAELAQLARRG